MKRSKLTGEEMKVMRLIANGADIWGFYEAGILRRVERDFPLLITITKATNAPKDGAKQQPYFGAILTPTGLKRLRIKRRKV
mgnify:CR=1 FL=1